MSAESCGTYSTSEGLNYTLYCDQDAKLLGDIGSTGAKSVEECMDLCAKKSKGACGSAVFDRAKEICYYKSRNVTLEDVKPRNGATIGFPFAEQMKPLPVSCTANQTSENGLNFSVYCDQNLDGSDMAVGNRSHAATFSDCLNHCSTLHPLCTGVLWDSTMNLGWRNCLPKQGDKENRKVGSKYKGSQAGVANFANVTIEDCRANSNGTTSTGNNVEFKLTCGEDRFGSDIETRHADSYQECVDLCDKHTGDDKCVGVVHDSKMVNGYENCYLKSAIGVATSDKDGYTFALRQDSPDSSDPSDPPPNSDPSGSPGSPGSPGSSGSKSKAWIAGPVIGIVAAVLLIMAIVWWRRKRGSKKDAEAQAPSYQEMGSPDAAAYGHNELASSQHPPEKHPELAQPVYRHEMGTDQGVIELPAGVPSRK